MCYHIFFNIEKYIELNIQKNSLKSCISGLDYSIIVYLWQSITCFRMFLSVRKASPTSFKTS